MSDLSDITLQQIRTVMREEVTIAIKPLQTDIVDVKQDIIAIKQDVTTIKKVQGTQSLMMGEMRADIRSLKNISRVHTHELHKLGVLFEDLDSRFEAAAEAE